MSSSNPEMSSSNPKLCVTCGNPLTVYNETDEEDGEADMNVSAGSYVADEIQFFCGCYFHWQCLLDAYTLNECPKCGRILTSASANGEQLLCNVKNERGTQLDLDILPLLMEESYLKAFSEERKCRSFLEFCGEGDIEAIVDLLNDQREEYENATQERTADSSIMSHDVLRYQDQIGSMGSGLHAAIENGRIDVAWLLLLLTSQIEMSRFPNEVLHAADEHGIAREEQTGKVDIRTLRDSEGRTAEDRAAAIGGIWSEWVQSGRLKGNN